MSLLHLGGCHCGALRWSFASTQPLADFAPRACDCSFCTRHAAAWVSDAQGSLRIESDSDHLQRYHQGSGQAEFLLCRNCGVLIAVAAAVEDGNWRGALNRNSFDERESLGTPVVASPQKLTPEAKLARWSQLWTPMQFSRPE